MTGGNVRVMVGLSQGNYSRAVIAGGGPIGEGVWRNVSDKFPKILTDEERDRIAAAISEKVKAPCPRCGNTNFVVMDGYFCFVLSPSPKDIRLAGQVMPCAAVLCDNCGFSAFHSIGALGMMPKEEGEK